MILFGHVILQNQVIKDLWAGAHQGKLPTYQVGDHRHRSNGDLMILV